MHLLGGSGAFCRGAARSSGTISGGTAASNPGCSLVDLISYTIALESRRVDWVVEHGVEAVCQLVQLLLRCPVLLDVARLACLICNIPTFLDLCIAS